MKGLIVVNAYRKPPATLLQAQRLSDELRLIGIGCRIVANDRFMLRSDGRNIVADALDCDFCVYLDKDKYLSAMLEKLGVRLFNRHAAIRKCDDKMETQIALAGSGVVMPAALAGQLCYDPDEKIKEETLDRIESALGYPVIVKTAYGSLGKGVHKAENRAQLRALCERVKMQPHLFQQAIAQSFGRDMRVIAIGGKALCQMRRVANGDFRSNIELGGCAEACDLPESYRAAAETAARALGLDYCGVDLLEGDDGEPIVCEVNSNAFFQGMERVTGVNVAAAYARHIARAIGAN